MIRATGNGKMFRRFFAYDNSLRSPVRPQAAGTMKKKLIPALLGGAVGLFLLLEAAV